MINGKKILAVIPARGGSKGLPKKNIKKIAGKPLIAYSIEEAENSKYLDRIIVSTDDKEIKQVVEKYGNYVPFLRPKELATDSASSIDVILHVVSKIQDFDYIMMLQPTSPLRRSKHIDECIELLIASGEKTSVSLTKLDKHPNWMFTINKSNSLEPYALNFELISRRQNLETVYVLNGAIYLSEIDFLLENKVFIDDQTLPYIMPVEHSIDIDTSFDVKMIECLLRDDR